LKDTNLDPTWLELEITESSIMKDPELAIEKLLELKMMGIKVAIDDFGTGYSSLNYLKRFPIDTLKIDRSFVSDLCKDPHDTAIVRAIITLGHALDLTVIAEGVETREQLESLTELECDVVQGFLFSKALSVEDFEAFLSSPHFNPKITQRGSGRNQIIVATHAQIQNQERSDCTLESSCMVPIVFFSLACSPFAPQSQPVLISFTVRQRWAFRPAN
jgi:predicted signal transduction protein with EAL and GGDEF domain